LRGIHRINQYNFAQLLNKISYVGVIVVLLLESKLSVTTALLATIFALAVSVVYIFGCITRISGLALGISCRLARESFRFGLKEHIGNVAQNLNLRLDWVILAAFATPAAVGIYSIAVLIAEFIWYIPDSIGVVLFPAIASSERPTEKLTAKINRIVIFLTLCASLLLILLGRTIISVLYGPAFSPAFPALMVLLPGIIGLTAAKIISKYTSGIGRPLYNSKGSILALAVNVPLLWYLVPKLGIIGAALASSVAYSVYGFYMIQVFRMRSGLKITSIVLISRRDIIELTNNLRGIFHGRTKME
ncbi:MAG: polysaccharide biosynthesis C-terminal domain-containing protein, partial [archaeon]